MLTWPELPYKSAGGSIAAACARGKKQNTYTLNLRTFDVATVRKVYSDFGNFVKVNQQAASSLLLFEIFPAKGVDAMAANSAAYPNRGKENILAIIEMIYDDDASANVADDWAKAQRSEFEGVSGYDKLYVYQNYAHGDEPIEAIYGYEAWRLRKLKAVKKAYDPKVVFNGYHNIPV
jgi:fumiquinazoline A oxidase